MLLHPTLEKLTTMRFSGMAAALEEQMKMDGLDSMGFEERLGLLLDQELSQLFAALLNKLMLFITIRCIGRVGDIDQVFIRQEPLNFL